MTTSAGWPPRGFTSSTCRLFCSLRPVCQRAHTHTHTNSASSRGGLPHPNELLSLALSACAALCAAILSLLSARAATYIKQVSLLSALCAVMLSALRFALGAAAMLSRCALLSLLFALCSRAALCSLLSRCSWGLESRRRLGSCRLVAGQALHLLNHNRWDSPPTPIQRVTTSSFPWNCGWNDHTFHSPTYVEAMMVGTLLSEQP